MNILEKVFDSILDILSYICGLILIFIMISVCIDVITRYFLNRPMQWVIEISEYSLVYLTFLGTAWVLKRDGHVSVDILIVRLKPKTRVIMGIINSIIGILVCLVIVWFGTLETVDNFQRGVRIPSILEFPKAPLLAVIPFGSFFLMIQFLRNLSKFVNEFPETSSKRGRSKS